MAKSSENGDYQLARDQQVDSSHSNVGDDIIDTKPTWTLPPKALPARGRLGFFRSIFFASLITAFSVATLLVLLTRIRYFLPDSEYWDDNTVSCDLVSAKASAFENTFTIDLRSSLRLSFAVAKLIDVVWDLVIGQGGRLLLAWISYGVFMDGLTRLMETSAVSYQLYAFIVVETSSLTSIWCSLKAVSTGHGWRGRAFLAWFGLATLYILAYPTLMSAATGYLTPSDIRYRVLSDTLISPDSHDLTACVQIHNAPAIGLDEGYIVLGPPLDQWPLEKELKSNYTFFNMLLGIAGGKSSIDIFSLILKYNRRLGRGDPDVYDYIKANNLSSNITKVPHLPFAYSGPHMGLYWSPTNGSNSLDLGDRIGINNTYCYQKNPLPSDFRNSSECVARSYFVWGFSSILLYIVLSLQLVWIVGMFTVWLDANVCSKLCRRGRKMRGSFRNALDLAEATKEVLGDDLCAYSNRKIARQLAKSGRRLQFYSTNDSETSGISHIGLSSFTGSQKLDLGHDTVYGGLGKDHE